MNEPGHNERLLADVLGEGVSADFREGLLSETLRLARRRRRFRQVRNAASALAVLVVLGLLVWHQFPSGQNPLRLAGQTLHARPHAAAAPGGMGGDEAILSFRASSHP